MVEVPARSCAANLCCGVHTRDQGACPIQVLNASATGLKHVNLEHGENKRMMTHVCS